ncbi:ribonuclease P protein component [Portibacter marinus]|uniref:ribonuclease P protein component n=1 Tax=Portibacter marinus TaxID=2898660 RepID=UPI001F27C501|nr:ribonuclease P protein component [Portibacter marinus]
MQDFSFPKSERLTNKKKFESLFSDAETVSAYPLRLIYILHDRDEHLPTFQIAFTVPKRKVKKAVDRNFLKRRMREAYRLNKHSFIDHIDQRQLSGYGIMIYTGQEKMTFHQIEKAWKKIERKFVLK